MTIFYLIRHGQTDWNKEGKYTGQTDISINKTGEEQAKEVASKMSGLSPDLIYSSDLRRARETAQIISDQLKIPVRLDKRLREIHQGDWEGMHVDEIRTQYTSQFDARKQDPLGAAAPGGESIGDVKDRVDSFLDEIRREHPQGEIVIASHGIVLGIIRTIAMRLPVEEVFNQIPGNAELFRIEIET